jgi:hypothetical protein
VTNFLQMPSHQYPVVRDVELVKPGHLPVQETKSRRPVWLWLNLLSLDAPLVAVLWLNLFATAARIDLPWSVSLVLALVVWLIYIADRIFDTLRPDKRADLPPRHRFYRAHRNAFLGLLLGLFVLTCWECRTLDPRTLRDGVLLSFIVAGYFVAVHWARSSRRLCLPKEAVVGIVFGMGTFLPVWAHLHGMTVAMLVTVVLFMLLCWLNAVLIEHWEWVRLRWKRSQTPHGSTITVGAHLLAIGSAVAIAAVVMMLSAPFRPERLVLLAAALSAMALAAIGFSRRLLSIHAIPVLADAALLTPGVVLLFLHR